MKHLFTHFLILSLSLTAYSATKTWTQNGSAKSWNTINAWSPSGVPAAGDHVIINGSGSATILLDANTANLGSLTMTAGNVQFSADISLNVTGSVSITGGSLTGNGIVHLNGGNAQTLEAVTLNSLTIDNAAGVSLLSNVMVTGTLSLMNGHLRLGDYHLKLSSSASISGSFSSSNMIVTNGTGELRKEFSSTGSFLFPIGDISGTTEYSPVTLDFTSGTFAAGAFAGVCVVDDAHPDQSGMNAYLSRQWLTTASGITAYTCNPALTYVDADINGNEAFLQLGQLENANWSIVGDCDPFSNTLNGVMMNSLALTTGIESVPLPVELVSFTASLQNGKVKLIWKTESESNNYGFEIQKSVDGKTWQTTGFVEGAGTSNKPRSYGYVDAVAETFGAPVMHYRLRQIDRDGTDSYSGVATVKLAGRTESLALNQNYPNPFNPTTTISFTLARQENITLVITDASGSHVATLIDNEALPAGNHLVNFTASELPSGTYFSTIITPDAAITRSMRLMK